MVQTLKEEVMGGHNSVEHVVLDTSSYTVSILEFNESRKFSAVSAETKKNVNIQDVNDICAAVCEYVKNNSEETPCYLLLDLSLSEIFTLSQITCAAKAFTSMKTHMKTRLVGSVVKCSDEKIDNFLVVTFQKVYVPIRPLRWWEQPQDGSDFITVEEAKLLQPAPLAINETN
jgi:hypothetical protein